jgi:hypothetical protein
MNDKVMGVACVTIMFLSVVGAWVFTEKPLDPAIKELGQMIISGIMGTMIGISLRKKP